MAIFSSTNLTDAILRSSVMHPVRVILRDIVSSLSTGEPQELTASGAVTQGVQKVELNHATVAVAATIADASYHEGMFAVTDTSASGTAAHTLTLTSGTFDGTNNKATMNAPGELLVVLFDSDGNGTIVQNTGSVALATV